MTKYWNVFLLASWNYAEIEELLNMGSGGGSQFQPLSEFLRLYRRTLKKNVYPAESRKSAGDSTGGENLVYKYFF
jgi:hypothetical protein